MITCTSPILINILVVIKNIFNLIIIIVPIILIFSLAINLINISKNPDNYQFYEGGRVGTNGRGTMDNYTFTSFGSNSGGYTNNKVWKIIRLN